MPPTPKYARAPSVKTARTWEEIRHQCDGLVVIDLRGARPPKKASREAPVASPEDLLLHAFRCSTETLRCVFYCPRACLDWDYIKTYAPASARRAIRRGARIALGGSSLKPARRLARTTASH